MLPLSLSRCCGSKKAVTVVFSGLIESRHISSTLSDYKPQITPDVSASTYSPDNSTESLRIVQVLMATDPVQTEEQELLILRTSESKSLFSQFC